MARRFLTSGEITLAQSIFGNSIDYSTIGVFDRGYAFLNVLGNMSYRGNIYLPRGHETDFSTAPIARQRLFIHEMVHVWQHQNRVLNLVQAAMREAIKHRLRYARAYLFYLDHDKDLLDYGLEQQAAIVEEYFLRRHGGGSMGRCQNRTGNVQALLDSVLGRFLADPSYANRRALPASAAVCRRAASFAPTHHETA